MQVDIVSAEQAIYSGSAKMVFATGTLGELGIAPNHAQLLTSLKPGVVRVITADDKEEVFYMSGGLLEVQPYVVTVLADTALHAVDIDEAAAQEAKQRAEQALAHVRGGMGYSVAAIELAKAVAQIRVIRSLRKTRDKL